MRYALFALLLLAAPPGAFALTWDFDDGSTWGWAARPMVPPMNRGGTNAPLHSEVVDGVWRLALVPGQRPMVQLVSPVIGEDSALFDRLTLRMRFIHHSPIEGHLWMHWSNVKYNRRTDFSVNEARFSEERRQLYPIQWEEISVDLRALAEAGPAVRDYPATWEDTLFNFHLTMWGSGDVDDYPTFLEIDSIQLTGAEELAQGELVAQGYRGGGGAARHVVRRPRFQLPRRPHQAVAWRCGGRHRRRWRRGSRRGLDTLHGRRVTNGLAHGVQRRAGPL